MGSELEVLDGEFAQALNGLDSAQTQLRPRKDGRKWSIQQIVDHLHRSYVSTERQIELRIEKGQRTKARPGIQQRVGQIMITTLGIFPKGRLAPDAVAPQEPTELLSGQELAGLVSGDLDRLETIASRAEQVFGKGRAVSHMVLGPLSMRQWRRFHLVHGRHHLKQVAAIRREHGV